ncbi:MAG: protease SohB [Proteobacteria bacterium]|nr:MAG: protease SohB [Pseudomonadota bacterium]
MESWTELGLFAAKAIILVAAALAVIAGVARAASRGNAEARDRGKIKVRKLNDVLRKQALALRGAVLPRHAARAEQKLERKRAKAERKAKGEALTARLSRPRTFVVDFDGNLRASRVSALREEITAIVAVARPGEDEVVVRLKSPGGMVHAYGLAAAQLQRVRERGVKLTASVDLVAASGGYMMACVADQILAAPFAVVGSIGVVAGIPNLSRLLKKHDIDYELLTAGQLKRTLTVLGPNTAGGRQRMQEELDDTHALFKSFVARHRPGLDLDTVATGEFWYGSRALELGLVDRILTSDDYLVERAAEGDVFAVEHQVKRGLLNRLGRSAEGAMARGLEQALERLAQRRLPS